MAIEIPEASRIAFAEQHDLTLPGESGRPVDWEAVDADILKIARPMMAAVLREVASEAHQGEGGAGLVYLDAIEGWIREIEEER